MIYDQLCRERGWIDHRTVLPLGQVRTTTAPPPSPPTRRRVRRAKAVGR